MAKNKKAHDKVSCTYCNEWSGCKRSLCDHIKKNHKEEHAAAKAKKKADNRIEKNKRYRIRYKLEVEKAHAGKSTVRPPDPFRPRLPVSKR